jgi:hypothetical protein
MLGSLTAGDPNPDQMRSIEARRAIHRELKSALEVTSIGAYSSA